MNAHQRRAQRRSEQRSYLAVEKWIHASTVFVDAAGVEFQKWIQQEVSETIAQSAYDSGFVQILSGIVDREQHDRPITNAASMLIGTPFMDRSIIEAAIAAGEQQIRDGRFWSRASLEVAEASADEDLRIRARRAAVDELIAEFEPEL